jgi:hypothetical protein
VSLGVADAVLVGLDVPGDATAPGFVVVVVFECVDGWLAPADGGDSDGVDGEPVVVVVCPAPAPAPAESGVRTVACSA